MAYFEFPHTRNYDGDLGWIIKQIDEIVNGNLYQLKIYKNSLNTMEWTPGIGYPKNTLVTYQNGLYLSSDNISPSTVIPPEDPTWTDMALSLEAVNELSDRLTELEEDFAQEKLKRKYIFITDSYGRSGNPDPDSIGWPRKLAEIMNITRYTDYDYGFLDGAGFVSDGRLFSNVLQTVYNNLPDTLPAEEITDVVVAGGTNDVSASEEGIVTAMNVFTTLSKQLFPNATVWIAEVGNYAANATNRANIATFTLAAYFRAFEVGAVPIMNAYKPMLIKKHFYTDGTHPTAEGTLAIAEAIYKGLNGDGYSLPSFLSLANNFTPASGFTGTPVVVCQTDDSLRITLNINGALTFQAGTMRSGQSTVIGTLNTGIIYGALGYGNGVSGYAYFNQGPDGAGTYPIRMLVLGNDLYIQPLVDVSAATSIALSRDTTINSPLLYN